MKSTIIALSVPFFVLAALIASVGQSFTNYESLIACAATMCVIFLGIIAIDVSKIAKSLEKNAVAAKSSEISDEQGKK